VKHSAPVTADARSYSGRITRRMCRYLRRRLRTSTAARGQPGVLSITRTTDSSGACTLRSWRERRMCSIMGYCAGSKCRMWKCSPHMHAVRPAPSLKLSSVEEHWRTLLNSRGSSRSTGHTYSHTGGEWLCFVLEKCGNHAWQCWHMVIEGFRCGGMVDERVGLRALCVSSLNYFELAPFPRVSAYQGHPDTRSADGLSAEWSEH
jgi:hypothetical protein